MGRPQFRRMLPESYVQLLYEYLEKLGHDPEQILNYRWPVPKSDGPGGVWVTTWQEMLEIAEGFLADPFIALHVGETITTRNLGVLGSILLACDHLGAALERVERYQRLIFDVIPMSVRHLKDSVEVVWDVSEYQPGRLVSEVGVAVVVQMTRILTRGSVPPPQGVMFSHAPPVDVRPYEAFFQCPVLFDQDTTAVKVGLDLLAMPLKSPDASLIAVLDKHADELLRKLPQEHDKFEEIRRQIVLLFSEGEPTLAKAAARLHLSSRTLQRTLMNAGTTFRRELNLIRRELALSYLANGKLKVVDVALLLGYSEHSAFTRAFKEWTGKTPQEEKTDSNDRRSI